ncbi:uncharacterized protein LOC106466685 isoform X2 [Limulus polyphemus]|nr:uncharacterized protein LOC106466685 isoform X2 [Limulus polyphemus]XP_022250456.1 uncharacterized protein LOC106466685 isoform X2 [Limulus polyphemus]XP_022250457.1 uncharacterized protein LOC106466685 isoform X2 [Limulus polyphemus]XP_022250458.1 uncharacterized protein LOC106466685 isoform X2 [Limulus polyphemus]XP_022250459.1 uncharacterized protein LOC106466685 isoform X2 [Limulus polyphemus]
MTEEIIKDIRLRLAAVIDAINSLEELRRVLHENAQEMKVTIKEKISEQYFLMRQREAELMQEIDAVTYSQQNQLLKNLSTLYHVVGELKYKIKALDRGSVDKFLDREEYGIPELQPPQKTELQFDDETLKSCILSFGKIEMTEICPENLACSKICRNVNCKSLLGTHHYKSTIPQERTKSLVQQWLQTMTLTDPVSDSEEFVMVTEEKQSLVTSSDSIELVSQPDSQTSTQELGKNLSFKDDHMSCNCLSPTNVEIENLDLLSCLPNNAIGFDRPINPQVSSRWLRGGEIYSNVTSVAEVCKANEKCQTFNSCVCEENCLVSAVREQVLKDDSNKMNKIHLQDHINEVIKDNVYTTDSSQPLNNKQQNWLLPVVTVMQDNVQKWLTNDYVKNTSKLILPECLQSLNNTEWLSQNNAGISFTENTIDVNNKTTGIKGVARQTCSHSDGNVFTPYYHPPVMSQWLTSASSRVFNT